MKWPTTPSEWAELALSLAPSVGPRLSKKFSVVLPLLNPKIADDMVVVSTILAFIAGAGTQTLCSGHMRWPARAFVGGLVIALLALLAVMAISLEIILTAYPGAAQFLVRTAYVAFFLGISVAFGGFLAS
jgi:hypothetical protein